MNGERTGRGRGGSRRGGFTLVEVMVAGVAGAILALAAGAMLWYGYLGWTRSRAAVEMQRDMRATFDVMTRAIRSGTNMSFVTGTVFTVQYADKPTATVIPAGSSLVYWPNAAAAGNQMTLVNGTLQRFAVTVSSNSATVVLVLSANGEVLSNTVAITRRN